MNIAYSTSHGERTQQASQLIVVLMGLGAVSTLAVFSWSR